MARARYTGRFSEETRKAGEKPTAEQPTQRGPETPQRVRERLVREALAVNRSPLRLGVERGSLPIARPEQKLRINLRSPKKK